MARPRSSLRLILGRSIVGLLAIACAATLTSGVPAAEPPTDAQFQTRILGVLEGHCVHCHGADVRKADLDLSSREGVMRGGESGTVVVPGKPEESLLYEKLHAREMPPAEENDSLDEAELAAVREWIATLASEPLIGGPQQPRVTQHEVLPILWRRCAHCHGLRHREAELALHDVSAILQGGKSGPAIVPGSPEKSLLLQKVRSGEMPPRQRMIEASVKPMDAGELATIATWIAAGAPVEERSPTALDAENDPLVSAEDRQFWAFASPRRPPVPSVANGARVKTPVDTFIIARLETAGLSLMPEADRLTLLRRATFDLTGLPPTPAEIAEYLADDAPGAYERLIDRLLASARYGERWGRYWLDLAGYADSEGKREQDLPRPHAWRYRDYVIAALNENRPYDQFLVEQLAGDELYDFEHAAEITQPMYDALVATGFLRMAPDGTWANITNYTADRIDVISDELDIFGSTVLGLTVKCARCHSHKFDPLPQRDYYRLAAIFKGAFDENDWLKPEVRNGLGPLSQDVQPGRHLPYVTSHERGAWEAEIARIDTELAALRAERESLGTASESAAQGKALDEKIASLEASRPPEPRVQALWDRGTPTPTYVYRRGDPTQPGELVGPGVPMMLAAAGPFEAVPPAAGSSATGRRLSLARWLVRPEHPLTSRVLVNRVWKHHFGAGLVRTLGNFGRSGMAPSHAELLDWLAIEFVESGWDMKRLHRLLMISAVYRQSSHVNDDASRRDPENVLLSRMPLVRLDAEALYDSLLAVSGELDLTSGGPADAVEGRADGLVTPLRREAGWRRMIYVAQARKRVPTHEELFDVPQMNPNCAQRRDSTVAPQALYLLNNAMVLRLAESMAARVAREAGTDPIAAVERAFLLALGRPATEAQLAKSLTALAEMRRAWNESAEKSPAANDEKVPRPDPALVTFCHTLLNSAAFLYVD